jgi:hypothetical protein
MDDVLSVCSWTPRPARPDKPIHMPHGIDTSTRTGAHTRSRYYLIRGEVCDVRRSETLRDRCGPRNGTSVYEEWEGKAWQADDRPNERASFLEWD